MAFHLKPGIRGRATFTPADSFFAGLTGARGVTGPGHLWPLFVHGHEPLIRLAFAEATQFAFDPGMRTMAESGNLGELDGYDDEYFEAQIHGDISWADIDYIAIRTFDELEAADTARRLERFASDNGYQFRVRIL